jgi:hypothetical protein
MAARILTVTPHMYFKSGITLNENNIITFRDLYRKLSKIDQFDGHEIDETSLINAAQQLRIQADSNDYRVLLRECVQYEDIELTFQCVDTVIQGPVQQLSLSLPPTTASTTQRPKSELAVERSKEDQVPTILTEVECVLTIKHRGKDVHDFLRTYLLQVFKQTNKHE